MIDVAVTRKYGYGVTHSGARPLTAVADGVLARAVAAADSADAAAAETELYRRFVPRVRVFGLKHLGDRGAADDLTQQVMLVVIIRFRAGEVRDPDQIGSFVLGTCRMTSIGYKRSERRRAALHARFDARDESIDARDDLAVDCARIAPCLAAISERERTILLLSYYVEMPAPEIAAALGMTAGAVGMGRHRALASMRECIEARMTS